MGVILLLERMEQLRLIHSWPGALVHAAWELDKTWPLSKTGAHVIAHGELAWFREMRLYHFWKLSLICISVCKTEACLSGCLTWSRSFLRAPETDKLA
jgi:hypothetical protein